MSEPDIYPVLREHDVRPRETGRIERLERTLDNIEIAIERLEAIFKTLVAAHLELQRAYVTTPQACPTCKAVLEQWQDGR